MDPNQSAAILRDAAAKARRLAADVDRQQADLRRHASRRTPGPVSDTASREGEAAYGRVAEALRRVIEASESHVGQARCNHANVEEESRT